MPPTIILIRHGQAEHNATEDYTIRDPNLTQEGRAQCKRLEKHLRDNVPLANQVEAIISSPFRRTIQTTQLSLDWLLKRGIKLQLDPLWQENSDSPCDTGSPAATLRKEFPGVDVAALDPLFPSKAAGTPYAFTRQAVLARGQKCLRELYERPEKVIAVVSHSAFLRIGVSKRRYFNADFRIFTFDEASEVPTDGKAPELIESDITAGKGGMGLSDAADVVIEPWEFPPEE